LGGGVRIAEDARWAWLSPDERTACLCVTAEAASMEIAADMCTSLEERLKKLIQN
jgi:hypothetical protein